MEEEPKKSKKWVIVAVVAAVLCCLVAACVGLIYAAWEYGDQVFGLAYLGGGLNLVALI